MRKGLMVLLAALQTANCTSPPRNCVEAKREFAQCFDKHSNEGFESYVEHCLPEARTEQMKGVVAFDFEYNQFFEGEQSVPAEVWTSSSRPSLEFSEKAPALPAPRGGRGRASAWTIKIEGRRVPCEEILEGRQEILVDKVISQKLLLDRPSLFP